MTSMRNHSRYSENTLTLIEKCINDLKLTTLQKKAIVDDLKKGKPIPVFTGSKIQPARIRIRRNTQFSLKKAKRRLETIIQCGAYDIPVYMPHKKIIDREKEKQRLQDIFYGLDQIPEERISCANKATYQALNDSPSYFQYERMKELMKEIEERMQFLQSMEELGLKKNYNFEISNEIAQKVKQLEDLSKSIQKTRPLMTSKSDS